MLVEVVGRDQMDQKVLIVSFLFSFFFNLRFNLEFKIVSSEKNILFNSES